MRNLIVFMNKNYKQTVLNVIENEGFDYTFSGYTSFEDIKDEKFHLLRKEYLTARAKFAEYIGFKE